MIESTCDEITMEKIDELCKRMNCNKNKRYLQENELQSFFHDNFGKAREQCKVYNEEPPVCSEISDKISKKSENTLKTILEDSIKEFYRWEDQRIAYKRSQILSQKMNCSTKSFVADYDSNSNTQTVSNLTESQSVSNKEINNEWLCNNSTDKVSDSQTKYIHSQEEQEEEEYSQESNAMLYERTTNQLQCLRYRHFLRSQQQIKLQKLHVQFAESDAARLRQREFEFPLLVEDAMKYSAFLMAVMTNNKQHGIIDNNINNKNNNTVVKESAITPVILNKHGFALPYMHAPPPLFRSSSFASETVRLLKWLSTWDHAQQRINNEHKKSKANHQTRRHRHVRQTVQEHMESPCEPCDIDVAFKAYNNYREQWLDVMKEGLPTMQAVSPVLGSRTSPTSLSSPCAYNSVEPNINEYDKHLQSSDTNSSIERSQEEILPDSTNNVNKWGTARLIKSMPFHEEVEKENGLLGSSNIVYYDAFGNRLRSVRQARQQAEKLFATLANKEKMSKQKGYFQQDEMEKVKMELSSNPLLSACVQSSYNSRKRPRVGMKSHQSLCINTPCSSSSSSYSSSSSDTSDSSENSNSGWLTSSSECEEEHSARKRTKKHNHHVHDITSVSSLGSNNSTTESEGDEEINMECEYNSDDDNNNNTEFITNIAVIGGPTGVGKTTAVYLAAELLQYRVVEMNASTLRCSRNVERLLAELTQSHRFTSFQAGRNVIEIEREFSKLKAKQESEELHQPKEILSQEQEPFSPFASTPEAAKHLTRNGHKDKSKISNEQVDRQHKKCRSNHKVLGKEAVNVKNDKRNGISLNAVNAFFGIASQQPEVPHGTECITLCNEDTFHKYNDHSNSNVGNDKENVKYHITKMNGSSCCDNETCNIAAVVVDSAQPEHLHGITTTNLTDAVLTENNQNKESNNATLFCDLEYEEEEQEQEDEQQEKEEQDHKHEWSAEIESFDISPNCCSPSTKCESSEENQESLKLERSDQINSKTVKEPKQKTLLLIEDADVMLGEEVAKMFYNSLKKLAMSSKIPIIITVTSQEAARVYNTTSLIEEEMLIASKTCDDELYIDNLHDKNKHSFESLSAADNCQYIRFDKTAAKQFFGEQTPYTYITPLSNTAIFTELLTIALVHANLTECNAEMEIKSPCCQEEIVEEQNSRKHSKQEEKRKRKMKNEKRVCRYERELPTQQEQRERQEIEEEWEWSRVIENKENECRLPHATLDQIIVQKIESIAHNLLSKMFNDQGCFVCKDVRSWLNELALNELHTWHNCSKVQHANETIQESKVHKGEESNNILGLTSESLTTVIRAGAKTNYIQDAFFSSCWDVLYGRFAKCVVINKLNCPRQRLWECDSGIFQYNDDVCAELDAENAPNRVREECASKDKKHRSAERRCKQVDMFELIRKTIRERETTTMNTEQSYKLECREQEELEYLPFVNVEDENENAEKSKLIVDLCNDGTPSSVNTTNSIKSNNSHYSPFNSNLSSKNNSPASLKKLNNSKNLMYKFEYALELNKSFTPLPVHLINTSESDFHAQSWHDAYCDEHTKQFSSNNFSTQRITTREQEKEDNVRMTCKRQRDIQHLYKNYIVGRDCSAYEDIAGYTDFFTH